MIPTQMEQLCQFEEQKSKVQQLCLPLYEKSLISKHGPKLTMSQTLKLQPKSIEKGISESLDNATYLNIQENPQPQQFQSHHSLMPSQVSLDSKTEVFNKTVITEEGKAKQPYNYFLNFLSKHTRLPTHDRNELPEKSQESQQLEKQQQELPKNTKECKICYSDVEMSEFAKPLSCQHEFCRECLTNHITQCILRAAVLEICCPESKCDKLFTEDIIEQYVSPANFQKYKKFHHRQIISQNKNVRWCPKPDCEHYVVGNGEELLVCQCGQQICFKCGNPYHKGLNCNDAMNHQYLQAKKDNQIHDCPNCKAPILKRGGCNHMTCYSCKYQFCWICKGKYSSYHYVIFNVFGCVFPGGQGANIQPLKNPMLLRIIMIIPKIILTLLMIALLLTVLPFLGIYGILVAPYQLIRSQCGFRFYRYSCSGRLGYGLLFFFLGIFLSPLTVGIAILISPCLLMYYLVEYV